MHPTARMDCTRSSFIQPLPIQIQSLNKKKSLRKAANREFSKLRVCAKVESPVNESKAEAQVSSFSFVRKRTGSSLLDMLPEFKLDELSLDLPVFDPKKTEPVDLIVVGAGPAGLAVAQQVSSSGLRVCCIDPSPLSVWPNNYGVWVDEFEAMGLSDCLDYTWKRAVVHLDDKNVKYLDRPYGRVNRVALKTKMMTKCIDNGVEFLKTKVDTVDHTDLKSTVTCSNGQTIASALVLDATGFSRRLIKYDQPYDPGYQAAYGIMAEVESHPFDVDTMLFMDWRDSHLPETSEIKNRNCKIPTFLYAMPLSPTKIFLEETSLVARPAVDFSDIQERLEARLTYLGIKVLSIEEDEYCLIPMGGVLPTIPQRVLGIGGTAGMVHPSTGYMVARTLSAAPVVADAIVEKLKKYRKNKDKILSESVGKSGDELAAEVWEDVWPLDRKEQREFFCFGMDVLLKLDLNGTRRFFDAFFDLSPFHWQGFLSSRLYLYELIKFGLSLFSHATNHARVEILVNGFPGLGVLISNVIKMRNNKRV